MPRWNREGQSRYNNKKNDLITPEQFSELVKHLWAPYDAITVLLYYTGARISEVLALTPEDFQVEETKVYIHIYRLKGSTQTEPISIRRDARHIDLLTDTLASATPNTLLFNITARSVNYELARFGYYPHYFRLNRISQMFMKGKNVVEVQSWTGLTLGALNHYLGKVNNDRTGEDIE